MALEIKSMNNLRKQIDKGVNKTLKVETGLGLITSFKMKKYCALM